MGECAFARVFPKYPRSGNRNARNLPARKQKMTSTAPLPPFKATESLRMPDEHVPMLDDLLGEVGAQHRRLMAGFLKASNWDEDVAIESFQTLQTHISSHAVENATRRAKSIGFIGTDPTTGMPNPCVVALEDGSGGIARTKNGYPIIAMFDHMPGEEADWIAQTHLAVERAMTHFGENDVPGIAFVLDLADVTRHEEESSGWSFLRYVKSYPRNYVVHVCGVPAGKATMANAFAKIVGSDVIQTSIGYEKLVADMDLAHVLPRWDPSGGFDFDFDKCREFLRAL